MVKLGTDSPNAAPLTIFFNEKLVYLRVERVNYILINILIHYFSGFIRGVSNIDRSKLLIGQSETMYLSRVKSVKNNINMSAGFYLYDKDADCHRFISTQVFAIFMIVDYMKKKKILFITGPWADFSK